MLKRDIQDKIESVLFRGKAVIIYGARQVGKTTLVEQISDNLDQHSIYLNCDEPDIRESLSSVTSTGLRALIGDSKLVFIDEAQRVTLHHVTRDDYIEFVGLSDGCNSIDS